MRLKENFSFYGFKERIVPKFYGLYMTVATIFCPGNHMGFLDEASNEVLWKVRF